jgi:probable HAF family extracellular repeat protein
MKSSKLACCLGLLFAASTTFAQMYTVTDLGSANASAINASGQVAGTFDVLENVVSGHAFRTAPNSPIDPTTDNLGTLGWLYSTGLGINASGQVVGWSYRNENEYGRLFRTSPTGPIDPASDDLGVYGGAATGINDSGQVAGAYYVSSGVPHAFRTAPNSPVNPATDDLGTLGAGFYSWATGINALGQVVGGSTTEGDAWTHAFRTGPNSRIDSATDDLGSGVANAINASGQAVGWGLMVGGYWHAFRTAANSAINPATDDLGTLGGSSSEAKGINAYGQVVGYSLVGIGTIRAFLYDHVMHKLNDLIPLDSGWELYDASGINEAGQIVGVGIHSGLEGRAFLLTPIYKGLIQQPINADGSSVFSAKRGAVPVKFTLTQYDAPTCSLRPATIAITRTAGGTLGAIDESTYVANADSGSDFRINGCQYVYNLAASSLGVGTYRLDISIDRIMVGHAAFGLK